MNEAEHRDDFRQLTRLRLHEAKVLLDNDCYQGAYYLLDYAVECALKARIAKQVRRYTFPKRNFVSQVFTHDLNTLINSAGLELELREAKRINPSFADSWNVVEKWKETARYYCVIPEKTARDFYIAVTHKRNGVLPWLKKYW